MEGKPNEKKLPARLYMRTPQLNTPKPPQKNVNEEKLIQACQNGDLASVEEYLKQGVDPSSTHPKTGKTALQAAVYSNHLGIVKTLLDAGANVNKADNNGITPLMDAAMTEEQSTQDIIRLLVQRGAKINAKSKPLPSDKDFYGGACTAFHWAARELCIKNMLYLIEYGADIYLKSGKGASIIELVETSENFDKKADSFINTFCLEGTTKEDLKHLSNNFYSIVNNGVHNINKKHTEEITSLLKKIEMAVERKKSCMEIRKAARILYQGSRTGHPFFSVSRDINLRIASLTGNSQIHSEKEAIGIAGEFFPKR